MSLFDIKNRLYKKDFDENQPTRPESVYDIKAPEKKPDENREIIQDKWEKEKSWLDQNGKKSIKIGVFIISTIVFIALIVVGVYKFKQLSFSKEKVIISIEGQQSADSGKLLSYKVKINNQNKVSLKDASLKIIYPESFKPEGNEKFKKEGQISSIMNLSEINGNSKNETIFNGKAYSPKGALIYLKAELTYTPSNFNSRFSSISQVGVNVISAPISLEIMAPQNIADGDSLDYLVNYKNSGQESFEGIRVRVEYPEGFTFSNANPKPSEGNNVWYVGNLAAGQEGKIVISGKMEGSRDDVKNVRAQIGSTSDGDFASYNDEKTETKIAASPLSISQTVNGVTNLNVNAGDNLYFKITFKNESDIGLRDVILTEKLESPALDYESLELKKGSFDFSNKLIIWKAPDIQGLKLLAPGQSGSAEFRIKAKNIIPVNGESDKNFVISSIAKIDSPDIPTPIQMNKIIAGNKMDMKLNSKLILDTKGFYSDANIPNSGPIPPTVGQKTTYTIYWMAHNISNDVTDAKVEANLPTGSKMTGKIFPGNSNITYNERANSIVWEIGNIASGTGIISRPKEVAFQIEITPSPDQTGKEIDLVGPAKFSAKDLFTGENLSFMTDGETTFLTEDASIGLEGYKVKSGS